MHTLIFATLLILFTSNVYGDMEEAQELFEEAKCVSCHKVSHFKVRETKVNSFEKLHSIVNACVSSSGTSWFEEEIVDVSSYLNEKYYHFKDKKNK